MEDILCLQSKYKALEGTTSRAFKAKDSMKYDFENSVAVHVDSMVGDL